MLHTTFRKLKEHQACTSGYKQLAVSLGGITKYGRDTPIPLDRIMESNGMDDTVWCLRCTLEDAENLIIEFACDCAERVLGHYERYYPEDKRPRQAIEAARACVTDKSPASRAAAEAAAWAAEAAATTGWAATEAARAAGAAAEAARAAAGDAGDAVRAAWVAAWAAAGAAEAAARAAWAAGDAATTGWVATEAPRAAWAAAEAAEYEWQKQHLLELLKK